MFNLNDVPFQLVKGKSLNTFNLMVDGTVFPRSTIRFKEDVPGRDYDFSVVDRPAIDALFQCTLNELDDFGSITLRSVAERIHLPHLLALHWEEDEESEFTGNIYACLTIEPELAEWKSSYSFEEYCAALLSGLKGCNEPIDRPELHLNEGVADLSFSFEPGEEALGDVLYPFLEAFSEATQRIEDLRSEFLPEAIVASFDFPDELRAPCMQYLAYFSEFLRDLGISADSSLRDEAGTVLFSVEPQDGIDALDRIREALSVYLKLPASPVCVEDSDNNYEADRLLFQIETYKHQIRMKDRELSMANREITQLNYWLDRVSVSGTQVEPKQLGGPQVDSPKSDEPAKAIGLTKVKKLEDYGVHLDLGEVIRRLRGKKGE